MDPVTPERLSGLRLCLCPSGLVGMMSGHLGGRIAFSIYGKAFSQGGPGHSGRLPVAPPGLSCSVPRKAYLQGQPYSLSPGGQQWAAWAGAQREESEVQGQVRLAASGPGVTAPLSLPSSPPPLRPLQMSDTAVWGLALPQGLPTPCATFTAVPLSYSPWIILIGKPSFLDFSITREL